jgi:hypothetical protein
MDTGLYRFQLLDLGPESVSASQVFVELGDLFAEDADFLLVNLAGLLGGPTGFHGILDFVRLSSRKRIELIDPLVSLRNGLLQLLDRAAMDSFPIAQFDLQLMHTVSGRFQLLHLGAELVPVGEPFVELGDLVSQNPDFFFQDLLGLFGSLTGLLSPVEFVGLIHRARVELTDAPVALHDGLLELLDGAPMGRFPITQLDL